MLQGPDPNVIAQAAGHLDRDSFFSRLGLTPEEMPEFREMALMLWSQLEDEIQQLKEVSPA